MSRIDLHRALVACAALIAIACGDDGSGTAEDGGTRLGTGGSSGAGGGGGSGPGAGCSDPLAEDVVFSPRDFSEGSVIYQIVEDDGTLFFSTIDKLYRVDAEGGEPEELYYREFAIVVKFWVREGDILILQGGDTLLSLPKDGGETTELATLPFDVGGGLDGSVDMIVEGDFAYAKSTSGGFDEPAIATFHEIDLTDYTTRELASGEDLDGSFIKAGDALFVAADDPSVVVEDGDFGAFVPDLLYRISIESGEVEEIAVSGEPMKMGMLGASGDSLYLLAAAEDDFMNSGVFRLPMAGGELEKVYEMIVLFGLTFGLDNTASMTILRYLDTFFELGASGPADELFCVGGGAYTSHGWAATDDYVWMGQFHSRDELAFIVRKAIP